MRKTGMLISILFLFLAPALVFAYDCSTTSHNFEIKGFYRDSTPVTQSLILEIFSKDTATRVYHSGDVTIDDRSSVTVTSETTVFSWRLTGVDITTGFRVTFSITPLQAYQSGMYFIPKHTYKMYRKTGETAGIPEYVTTSYTFSTKREGSFPYTGYRSGSSGTTVITAGFSYTFTNTTGSPVNHSEEGYFTLQVAEDGYDTESAVNFTYVSYVTVGFETL
ncbi:MAG: hypothetical protein IJ663_05675 [Spirochaetales bacterium]|nr:hypothetical protein [Spirochaetales bacterium]